MINYTTVHVNQQMVRFDCEICNAVWYVDNKQLDYQAFVGCVKCGIVCEIEGDEE